MPWLWVLENLQQPKCPHYDKKNHHVPFCKQRVHHLLILNMDIVVIWLLTKVPSRATKKAHLTEKWPTKHPRKGTRAPPPPKKKL